VSLKQAALSSGRPLAGTPSHTPSDQGPREEIGNATGGDGVCAINEQADADDAMSEFLVKVTS
jgi:hypothetical protein